MIKFVTITNALGASISIPLRNPEASGFLINGIFGVEPVKANMVITNTLNTVGGIYNMHHIPARNIVLALGLYPKPTIETSRMRMVQHLNVGDSVTLRIVTDSLDVTIDGYVDSMPYRIFSKQEGIAVSVICPYPYFNGGEETVIISGPVNGFEFDFVDEPSPSLIMSEILPLSEKVIISKTGITTGIKAKFDILGTIGYDLQLLKKVSDYGTEHTDILSISAAKIVDITGAYLQRGDQIVISTIKNDKYATLIRSTNRYDILAAISITNDWISIDRRTATISYEPVTAPIYVSISYPILYGGL